jgi:hypothetical protein
MCEEIKKSEFDLCTQLGLSLGIDRSLILVTFECLGISERVIFRISFFGHVSCEELKKSESDLYTEIFGIILGIDRSLIAAKLECLGSSTRLIYQISFFGTRITFPRSLTWMCFS